MSHYVLSIKQTAPSNTLPPTKNITLAADTYKEKMAKIKRYHIEP
jgi:hypothetical protein